MEIARFCLNIPVLARKRPLLFWMLYGELGAKSCCSSFFPHAVLLIFCSAVGTTVKGRTPQLPGGSSSAIWRMTRFWLTVQFQIFLKGRRGGDGGTTKKNEAKNRLRCILMVWTKLSTKHNFTNCEGFQKSFLAKWLSWVLHLSLLTAEKVPNGDDMTDGFYPLHLLSWDKRASSWQSCLPRFRQII